MSELQWKVELGQWSGPAGRLGEGPGGIKVTASQALGAFQICLFGVW